MFSEQTVCIANIGPKERRKRLNSGLVALALSIVILVVLVLTGVDRWWRLALLLPLWVSMSGIFQVRERT